MRGINSDGMDKYICQVDDYISDIKNVRVKMLDSFSRLSDIFSRNNINNIGDCLDKVESNYIKVEGVLRSYSNTLRSVRKAYLNQEEKISMDVANASSRLEKER